MEHKEQSKCHQGGLEGLADGSKVHWGQSVRALNATTSVGYREPLRFVSKAARSVRRMG